MQNHHTRQTVEGGSEELLLDRTKVMHGQQDDRGKKGLSSCGARSGNEQSEAIDSFSSHG